MKFHGNAKTKLIMGEVWKNISGYNGKYQVSSIGRIRSYKAKGDGCFRILSLWQTHGYNYVWLCKNGRKKSFRVCRLVGMAFLDNPNDKPEINHIDFDRGNDKSDNLEWCTRSENLIHAFKNGRTITSGEDVGTSKLKKKEVEKIRSIYKEGKLTQEKIGKMFNVGQDQISRIVNKKLWRH